MDTFNLETSSSRGIYRRCPFLEYRDILARKSTRVPNPDTKMAIEWDTRNSLSRRVLLALNIHRGSKFIPRVRVNPRRDSSQKYLNVCKIGSEHVIPGGKESEGKVTETYSACTFLSF